MVISIMQRTFLIMSLLFALTGSNLMGCGRERRPTRYLIPNGYVGWLVIVFNVKTANPLTIEDNIFLVKFPSLGRAETSSTPEYGAGQVDEYYYDSNMERPLELGGTDGRGMIWGEHNGSRSDANTKVDQTFEAFFVGTYEDYRTYGWCAREDDGFPKVGLLDKNTANKCPEP